MTLPARPDYRLADLESSHLRDGTYATRRRRQVTDVGALVCLMIALLFLLPSAMAVPVLSTVGRPALLVGAALTLAWLAAKLHPHLAVRGPQPLRWMVAFFLITLLLSYAAGQGRGLTEVEARSSDLSMAYLLIFCGIVLACADGIPTRERLGQVIRMLVWCAAGVAVIGLLQSLADIDLTEYIIVPGLASQYDTELLGERSGFERIASTTGHFIEFSAVMAVTLPFAIHLARFGAQRLTRQLAVASALLIAAAIPLTLSRTGILGVAVMVLVMLPAWSWRIRFNVLMIGGALTAAAIVARPRLVGTVWRLFTDWDDDNSIQGRTGRYDTVYSYFSERPLLGRGPGTFVPDLYLILDNQWLATLVSGGLVGVAGLAAVHIVTAAVALHVRRHATSERDRHLAACLLTAQLIAVVAAGTFDSFAFTTFTTTIAICAGLTGALWRLSHSSRDVRTTGARLGRT